jgi:hypothetical protein
VNWRFPTILFFLFTIGWLLFVAIDFLGAVGSDCSYIRTEACRIYMQSVPQLTLWRGATVELIALGAYLWFRKR